MVKRRALSGVLVLAGLFTVAKHSEAQQPARAPGRGGAPAAQASSTLAQMMKGILFTNSNVIFFAQSQNPAEVAPAKDPSTATDPLANTYGKWEAVENSSLALVESADGARPQVLERVTRSNGKCGLVQVRSRLAGSRVKGL
jgi:hypothetical protein